MKENFIDKWIIKDTSGNIEYIVTIEESKRHTHITYSLFASDDTMWCEEIRGKLLFVLTDTGNGIKIKNPKKKTSSFLYSEALYLHILLSINNIDCLAPSKVTIVDETEVCSIKII